MPRLVPQFNQFGCLIPFKMRANLGVIDNGNQSTNVVVRKILKYLKDTAAVVVIPKSQASEQPSMSTNVVMEPCQVAKLMPIR